MTNLEAYFRIYGIKIAQETFPKQKPIEPIGISPEFEKMLDDTKKLYDAWRKGIGIPERLQGEPKKR